MTSIASPAFGAGTQQSGIASPPAGRPLPLAGIANAGGGKAAIDPEPGPSRNPNNAGQGTEQQLSVEQRREVTRLAARDREVRAHEAAHANVGGVYAGAPSYSYQRGPDGRNYAVSGEVSIDTSPVPGDPAATIAKAQVVRRAALAPAQPSLQDRQVANEALALEQNARRELLQQGEEAGLDAIPGNPGLAVLPPGSLLDTMA